MKIFRFSFSCNGEHNILSDFVVSADSYGRSFFIDDLHNKLVLARCVWRSRIWQTGDHFTHKYPELRLMAQELQDNAPHDPPTPIGTPFVVDGFILPARTLHDVHKSKFLSADSSVDGDEWGETSLRFRLAVLDLIGTIYFYDRDRLIELQKQRELADIPEGWTDPFFNEGSVWAFPPNAAMPLLVKKYAILPNLFIAGNFLDHYTHVDELRAKLNSTSFDASKANQEIASIETRINLNVKDRNHLPAI